MKYIRLMLAMFLLLCLTKMPYSYYETVRYLSMVIFFCSAYFCYKGNKLPMAYIYTILGLLFQPFIKIALGRTVWQIVDVVVTLYIIVSYLRTIKEKE
jgi:hypothetical protein